MDTKPGVTQIPPTLMDLKRQNDDEHRIDHDSGRTLAFLIFLGNGSMARSTKSSSSHPRSCSPKSIAYQALIFFLGCAFTTTVFLNTHFIATVQQEPLPSHLLDESPPAALVKRTTTGYDHSDSQRITSELDGLKILVALVAFDFSQLPHLEEVLDAYSDLCVAGSKVDIVIHSTVPWPVTLIDLLNTRFHCTNPSPRAGLTITVHLKSPSLRLHLVDCHRTLFYERLDDYDLFIYSEDDIRVSPKTVATYLSETKRLEDTMGSVSATNFNVGIVRYEYNYPPQITIDDKTRHATQNVTRVYWEHSWHPAVPKSVDRIPQTIMGTNGDDETYVYMTNHHQGMFLATRTLLQAWKVKQGCEFNEIKNRPSMRGKPSQPAEGTQRVWMSSTQLYGNKHCGIQQVLPVSKFGALTVWHMPNKNYRRVGRKGRLGGAAGDKNQDEKEEKDQNNNIQGPSDQLLSALQLHLAIREKYPAKPQEPYTGIVMEDHVGKRRAGTPLFNRRMEEYHAYVKRGGVLTPEDMVNINLVEDA